MKKVFLDARMIEHSGIGTYLRNLIPLLGKKTSLGLIVSPSPLKTFPWLASYELVSCASPIYSLSEQILLPRLIPPCDLFWSPHFNIPLLPIRAKKRLVTLHDFYHLSYFSTLSFAEKFYAKFVIAQAIKKADRVITVSSFSFSEMEKFFPERVNKVSVVHCGVDFAHYSQMIDAQSEQEICKRYALPENYFLFVGNLKPHKNLSGLLSAFQLLAEEEKEISLVVVGKQEGLRNGEPLAKLLERFPKLQKKVLWLQGVAQEDLPIIYHLAKALVFPSFYEGFGLPPLEAMASSCPVIASRIASIPEICEDAALYVDPQDPSTIKEAMKTFLVNSDARKQFIEVGKTRAAQFSWEKSAEKHLEIIEKIFL